MRSSLFGGGVGSLTLSSFDGGVVPLAILGLAMPRTANCHV
jgi:hypothetical protein